MRMEDMGGWKNMSTPGAGYLCRNLSLEDTCFREHFIIGIRISVK